MPQNKILRYLIFGLLYFSQGTILGYFASLNALYLLDRGLKMTDVGVFGAIALIPFVIKIFLGMLSDKVSLFNRGHRVPYILIGLLVQIVCLVTVPAVDPRTHYWGFVGLAFMLQMGMALYDTCTDGLALDTTPEEEQGKIQSFMVGGRAVGTIIAASLVGLLAQQVSWNAVFLVLAALTVAAIPPVLIIREKEQKRENRFDWSAFTAFKKWPVIAVGLASLLVFLVIAGPNQILNPFLTEELGISLSQAGMITSIWGIGVVVGSIVAGILMTQLKSKKAFIIMLALLALSLFSLGFFVRKEYGLALAIALVIFFGLAYGAAQTMTFALCMRITDARIAASMYAILMAFTNVGQGAGFGLAGMMTDALGFRFTYFVFAILLLLVMPFMPTVFRAEKSEYAAEMAD